MSNGIKTLLVTCFLVAMYVTFRAVANAEPIAIDSPDLNGIICQQIALGESPYDIAQALHQGDLRYSTFQMSQQVWAALQECG